MTGASGFVAVAGRPNAGKSTLLNRIAGGKVSIVSHRRQTTRSVVRFIGEHGGAQIAWLDTPGWQVQHGGRFNRALNVAAEWAVQTADAILFVTVAGAWTRADELLLKKIPAGCKVLCALNKIDTVERRDELLPMIGGLSARRDFSAIVPVSAKRGTGVAQLVAACAAHLPARRALLGEGEDLPFFFAELLREKIFRALGEELPYCVGVVAEVSARDRKLLDVCARVYVERDSQKPIVIGRGGRTLKRIATAARRDMEKYSGKKVYLTSQVHISDWRRDESLLRRMKIGVLPAS